MCACEKRKGAVGQIWSRFELTADSYTRAKKQRMTDPVTVALYDESIKERRLMDVTAQALLKMNLAQLVKHARPGDLFARA